MTVTCNNNSGDASLIQSALNGAGNIGLSGTCAIGSTTLTIAPNTCLSANPSATVNYTGTNYAAVMNNSAPNITINGITWNGGGIISHRTGYVMQDNLTITNNTVQNLTANGQDAFLIDPIQENFLFKGNTIVNIAPGGWSSVPYANANEAGNSCSDGHQGCQDYNGGLGLWVTGGMDNSTIMYNTFVQTASDGITVADNACL